MGYLRLDSYSFLVGLSAHILFRQIKLSETEIGRHKCGPTQDQFPVSLILYHEYYDFQR
jgi:hypothetical protein